MLLRHFRAPLPSPSQILVLIMTCNITNTPLYTEPLPLYQRNDPDTASIHSAAPSYVSETPTYTSRRPSIPTSSSLLPPLPVSSTTTPHEQARGLPAPRYAPGFQSRAHGSVSDIDSLSFNIGSWSSTRTSHASRQYHAVARRRANQAANTTAILNSLNAVPPPMASSSTGGEVSPSASSTAMNTYPVQVGSSNEPFNPLEDPYLVGEEAAGRARAQRVYREMCLRGEETVKYDSRSWEFMLAQMADWEERGKSWSYFRARVGQTKLLGRRLGLRT
ncbi:uncharacterized protein BDR25DRAFT_300735 [Lindgomyces ingoldianus]|uniref:Uncharacterized protein n=1 Tax=Lindgomyces ingoldianus TaxID=673940 RepID=A0ACB6RB35_9PLEO|nr:uncharacterized protein BDR25DRAFT_300735 [Lindgomyces ingoldianus]KAF2475737.1 hypothetical protein BDR25DRAFT_300735 [Lindgomyces ingoldianus]